MAEDILTRLEAKIVKHSSIDPDETVVEMRAGEFKEAVIEIIRLRALLEEIGESKLFSVKYMQKMARDGILPEGVG